MKKLLFSFLLGVVLLGAGCVTVEETGRRQLMLVSPSEEAQMGLSAFEQIKQEEKISTDPAVNARIQRIGNRIAAAVGRDLPHAEWEFVVFDSPQINAFALPGGKVGFYTGLIDLAENDDEIAIVMGHEVAHVTSRHGGERMSQHLLGALGGLALAVGTSRDRNHEAFMMAYGASFTLGTLAFSRSHELEADAVGLRFAARAGYDPRAGISFWQKMEARSGGNAPPKWLSTHPPSSERIAAMERLIPELMPVYEEARRRHALHPSERLAQDMARGLYVLR